VLTDKAGRFRFEGPRPVSYEGRPPHIHLRVVAAEHELLFTRYVPRTPRATRGYLRLVLVPQRV
jgi:protocatechuate 3,4-dioxygenase beta subunit